MNDRHSGKTTKIMEEAVELLGELEDSHHIFITGAHGPWLFQLSQEFKAAGLVNVEFYTSSQIIHGCLRGRHGVLLIDDIGDFSTNDRRQLRIEQDLLLAKNHFYRRR